MSADTKSYAIAWLEKGTADDGRTQPRAYPTPWTKIQFFFLQWNRSAKMPFRRPGKKNIKYTTTSATREKFMFAFDSFRTGRTRFKRIIIVRFAPPDDTPTSTATSTMTHERSWNFETQQCPRKVCNNDDT